ncbi:hypothetical protein C8R45DRAFT_1038896 [Mycena sanguinolenta]|nr:hypothetical protein C8R45DRAFT_1038896 [Mycena sanguinolenta]
MPSRCCTCDAFVIPTADEFELNLTTAPRTLARLTELSATNELPRDPEVALIRPILEKTSARLVAVDAEISRLEDRLRELKAERTTLARYHAQTTTILSPLRRMPAETLGEIFSWTLPAFDEVFAIKDSPWVLTHVCGGWRAVALAKPSLWSLINVDFTIKLRYPLEMLKIQIQRAAALKIHFYGSQAGEPNAQIALFKLLAEHSASWEELSIQLTSHLVPHVMDLYRDLPALRRAWVQWDTAESQTAEFSSVDFLRMAISLVDLGIHCEYRFLPTRLPTVHQLTRYDIDAPWATHAQLLRSLPNIEDARIRRHFDDDEDGFVPGEPIDVLKLRRLYVTDPAIFDYLRAPALEEISMQSTRPDLVEGWCSLERFLVRSACALRRLCIPGRLQTQSMAALLQQYPSLTEIAVIDGIAQGETEREILATYLTLFTVSDSTPSKLVFPHMTEIGLACDTGDSILFPLFLSMLESRRKVPGCALKAGELLFTNSLVQPDQRSVARLEPLREAGLRVSLLYGRNARYRVDEWVHNVEWT